MMIIKSLAIKEGTRNEFRTQSLNKRKEALSCKPWLQLHTQHVQVARETFYLQEMNSTFRSLNNPCKNLSITIYRLDSHVCYVNKVIPICGLLVLNQSTVLWSCCINYSIRQPDWIVSCLWPLQFKSTTKMRVLIIVSAPLCDISISDIGGKSFALMLSSWWDAC